MKKPFIFICLLFLFFQNNYAQDSLNMTKLDQWDPSGQSYNDVWGYVDGSGNEYAIVGSYDKIHFLQVTASNTLSLVQEFDPNGTTVWRDFKTYGNYAYAVSEGGNTGLLVYDLSNLPTSVSQVHQLTDKFTRAHNIFIDENAGKLYACGTNTQSNGLVIYDVTTNPPTHLASVPMTPGGYIHDLYVRNDTAYCSHGNNGFRIWDVSTPSSPQFLASYTGESGYNHSSWVTPDGNTAFYAREVGVGLPMTALDISNYNNIGVISNWKFPLLAPAHVNNVPHNPYLLGDYLFTSYYEDGVQVFDVSNPANVTVAGYYDTYPSNTQYNGYNGCWGVYPYLPSGRVLASDGVNGLFLLEFNTNPLVLQIVTQTDVSCPGGNDGSLTVLGSGGTSPYTYALNGGTQQSNGFFGNLTAGTYTVEVMDNTGNTVSTPVTINEPSPLIPFVVSQQNVTCAGNANGVILADATGGTVTTGYLFSLDGVNYTSNTIFQNLSGGTYTLHVRDNNNCEANSSFTIQEPFPLSSIINTQTNVDCFGNNTGSIVFFTTGGTAPYIYTIDQVNYQQSSTFSNLAAGTYTLETTDMNNCQAYTTFSITQPPVLDVSIAQQTNVDCFGNNIGEIILNGTGGTGNYQFNMDGGNYQSSNVFSNLVQGTYDFGILDANNCLDNISATITSPPEIVVSLSQIQNVNCFGENTGSVTVDVSGGAGNFDITMNGSVQNGNSVTFDNLAAGSYPILVLDANGCSSISNVDITENSEILFFLSSTQDVSCFGGSDGVIEVAADGGSGNYTFFLNGNSNGFNNTFTNLSQGQYEISVEDELGCQKTLTATVDQPSAIQLSVAAQTNVTCAGSNDGQVTLSASGGVGNFQYILAGTTNSTGVFNNLPEGNYIASVFDSNNCIQGITFEITAPAPIVSQLINQTNVDCFGGNTGSVEVQASGGVGNFSFTLGNETNSSGIFQNLSAGNYNIIITDANNCQNSINANISQPDQISGSIANQQNVNCFGGNTGSVEVQASGGTGNFNFTLGNETNSSGIFQNLSAGNYNIIITDANNCQNSINANISQPDQISGSIANQQNVNCFGGNTGSVEVQASGGVGNFSFTLGNETNSSGIFQNLSAGNYNIIITDANNCQNSINANISQPDQISGSIANQQNVNCFGGNTGSVEVQASGGVGNFSFTLGNETNSSGIFQNLSAGNYNIIITDDNNCQNSINANISQPDQISGSIANQQNVNCFGGNTGSVEVQASGGVGNFSFTLGNETNSSGVFQNLSAGNYNIIITDANNCQNSINANISQPDQISGSIANQQNVNCFGGNTGSVEVQASGGVGNFSFTLGNETNSSGIFQNLSAGNYNIIITDANNCQNSINANISQPDQISGSIANQQNVNCFGGNTGSVEVQASGGVGNFSFTLGNETNSSGIFQNLSAGNYNIIITDANNCQNSINANISQPDQISGSIANQQNVNCFGGNTGSVEVQASGGVGNFSFTLGNETNSSGVFQNLSAGNYNIIITDDNNCQNSINASILQPTELTLSVENVQLASCNGQEGSIQVSASGGTPSYSFSNGNETNSTGYFGNLPAGIYMITATDGNNCTTSIDVNIIEPNALNVEIISTQHPNCFGESTGIIQLNASGGTGTITYTLGNVSNTSGYFENLSAATYNIMVTDDNNCLSQVSVEITEPPLLELNINQVTDVTCYGENSGSINLVASGGSGILTFSLGNENNTDGVFENLPANNFEVLVTDENGCHTSIEFTINQPSDIEVNILQNNPANCSGENSGMVQLGASGGVGSYAFTMAGETNSTGLFENLLADDYLMNLTDGNGCQESLIVSVVEPLAIAIDDLIVEDALCFGENTGSIQVSAGGGVGQFEYTLGNFTNSTGIFNQLSAGNYSIEISDANGCTSSVQTTVGEGEAIIVELVQTQSPLCHGDANGTVELNATGGFGQLHFILGNEENTTGIFENLTAGTHIVTVMDINNCTSAIGFEIYEPLPLELNIIEKYNPDCFGGNNGLIDLTVIGGTGELEYTLGNETNTTGIFENLSAGIYEFQITDENLCSITVVVEIFQPEAIEFEILQQQNINCFGENSGSISLEASGGNGNFTYSLANATNTSGTFENLEAGTYNLEITDQNNCTQIAEIILTQPQAIEVSFTETQPIDCAGNASASVEISAAGGTGNFEYTLGNETNATGVFENLEAGNYSVAIIDQNGCTSTIAFEITAPQPLESAIAQTQNILCFGANEAAIEVSASGGTGAYFFTLNGETNSTGIFENLPDGTFEIQILDENNCASIETISITQPEELSLILENIQPAGCAGAATGSIQLNAFGGTGIHTYSVDNQSNTVGFFDNLSAGIYEVSVEDENGCSVTLQITVNENNDIVIDNSAINDATCFGLENGMIQIEASGGTGDLTYTIGNETNSTGLFENLPPGNYEVIISDAVNCNYFLPIEIFEPTALNILANEINPVDCNGAMTGSVQLIASGGVGNLVFELNGNASTDGWFYDLPAGSHIAMVIDSNDCSGTVIFDIPEPTPLSSDITDLSNDTGTGDGSITIIGIGGTPGYTYSLDGINFQNEGIFENLVVGNYTGYVQDLNGCISEFEFEIELETSISNPELGVLEMDVFPNPFSEEIILQMDLAIAQKIHWQLTSITGQQIFQETKQMNLGKQNILLNVEEIVPAGIYILSVKNDAQMIGHFKLIKQ